MDTFSNIRGVSDNRLVNMQDFQKTGVLTRALFFLRETYISYYEGKGDLKGGITMTLVKKVLNKTDEVFNNIDENDKHPMVKAFGCGAVDGFIDAAVLMYIPLVIGCTYWRRRATKK